MQERRLKIAFIGTHGVGKTTLCYGLAARLKRQDIVLDIVHEVARRCPLPVNEDTTVAAQSWILHAQISDELVAQARHPVVICDRSVLDNYVYLLLAAGRQPGLEPLVQWWLESYDLLLHVPIVDVPQVDGVRATDLGFQQAVEDRLLVELDRRHLDFVRLEAGDRGNWLDDVERRVREHIAPPQLPLL